MGGVELEVTDELVADEHGYVVALDDDVGGLAGVVDAEGDLPRLAFGDTVGGDHDLGAAQGCGNGGAVGSGTGGGRPTLMGRAAADATVGSLVVVVVDEGVQVGLEFL